jgi:hypothetical protein
MIAVLSPSQKSNRFPTSSIFLFISARTHERKTFIRESQSLQRGFEKSNGKRKNSTGTKLMEFIPIFDQ